VSREVRAWRAVEVKLPLLASDYRLVVSGPRGSVSRASFSGTGPWPILPCRTVLGSQSPVSTQQVN
jgi:hypothetical protein